MVIVALAAFFFGISSAFLLYLLSGIWGNIMTTPRRFDRALDAINWIERHRRRTLAEALRRAESTAKRVAPVDTGRLRRDTRRRGSGIGTTLLYGKFQEEGTRYIRPRRFIARGIQVGVNYIKRTYRRL